MDRLISADKLKAHYAWWKGGTRMMTMDEAKSDFDTIIDLQPTVEVAPRWIPCSERLPEYITQVLVQLTRTGDIFVGALAPNVEGMYTMWDLPNFSSYICLEDVIAWMPLPEPYSEVKE